ncbi:integral membrane protein [Streptococcus pneumoniae]|nr:integral membrane protein [Streptococcus pneumoniae]VLG06820.1 integral membrane protein [Streptococcus pneumoniae]VLY74967.1 integral membrane protein [Streptococcus pneumoniae]VST30710.1 integral membrane protein [Streptococcus pneumoniae]VSW20311.1 integral membrane protein [Streptococcus pneumoniae]
MQDNYTTKAKHLTIDSRRLIERWKKEGKSNREFASLLGKAPQTIHTEIKRRTVRQCLGKGRFKEVYSADYAQQSYENNRKRLVKKSSLTKELKEKILHYHNQKFLPEMMVMAKGVNVGISTIKDTEEAAVSREKLLLDQDRELAKKSLYAAYIQNGECKTSAQLLTNKIFLKNPLKALVEEKYGIEYEEFTNPWHAAISSFVAFFLRSLPPMLSVTIFPSDYRIPATVLIVGVALLLTGYTSARLGKAPTKTAMIRNLAIGLLTMGVTFLLEQLFSI